MDDKGPIAIADKETHGPAPEGILLVVFLMMVATATHWGELSLGGLILVVGAAALCLWINLHSGPWRISVNASLKGLFIVFVAMNFLLPVGMEEQTIRYHDPASGSEISHMNAYGMLIRVLYAFAFVMAVSYLAFPLNRMRRFSRCRFASLVAVAVAVRVLILLSSPSPKIDVFLMQTEGAQGLLKGENVYAMDFDRLYDLGPLPPHYGYPYPPAAFYPAALGWMLFKDVRVGWVLCDLLAVFLLYRLALRMNAGSGKACFRELALMTALFLPHAPYVIEKAWTEPLVSCSIAAVALTLASCRNAFVIGGAIGLFFSSKQYVVMGFPLLFRLRRWNPLTWIIAVSTALLLILPFALWDLHALVERAVLFFLTSPGRSDALSLHGALLLLGYRMPVWLTLILWLAGMLTCIYTMKRTLSGWLFSTASMWLFFFMIGKQAFMNYFYLIAFTMLLAVAASPQGREGECDPESPDGSGSSP